MPKKIASGIPNPSPSLPRNSAQNSQPVTPPAAEQSSASQAAGQASMRSRQAKEKGMSVEMRQRFYEEKRAENKAKADGWHSQLVKNVAQPLLSMAKNFNNVIKPLSNESLDLAEKLENLETKDQENQESERQDYLEQLNLLIKKFDEVIIDFERKMAEFFSESLPILESFDALPKSDKNSFYQANNKLEFAVATAKKTFIACNKVRASALLSKADTWNACIFGEVERLQPKYKTLIQEASSPAHSGTIHKDVEEIIVSFDKSAQRSMAVTAQGIEVIEDFDKMLTNPLLNPLLIEDPQQKQDIAKCPIEARIKNIFPHAMVMQSAKCKSHVLMKLVMLNNKEQQGNNNLQRWHALTEFFIMQEYQVAWSVNYNLALKEREELENRDSPSREEVQLMLDAAREGLSQFEKAIRTCEKTIEGYEKLEGVVKDDRMTSSLQELKTAMAAFLQAREFTVQFWIDKLQELEDKNDTFLPAHLQSKSSQKKADKTLASQQSSAQSESSRQSGFYKTTEGVVFGCVNEQGELDGLDEKGKVIATYFMDQDGSTWVKDYGDEADVPQSVSTVAPVVSGKITAVREKIERIVQKADNIAKASLRFSQNKLAKIASGSDYDDKFTSLNHAYSEKLKAIRALRDLLVDLEFELKESQGQDLPGKKLMAELNAQLARLQEDKQELGKQVAQAKKELDHHTFKGRNPTGTTFQSLLEQGQVASVKKEFNRRQSRNNADDWLDRYVISFAKGAQGEEYEPWIVHAHYQSSAAGTAPVRVHMKRNAEKDWGVEQQAYHSPPLSQDIFNLVKQEAQKQEAPSVSAKKGNRKRR